MILCPLPKWTPLSVIDHGPVSLTSAAAPTVFHLVTSPLICVIPLMVSVAVDGIINLRLRPVIITTETY